MGNVEYFESCETTSKVQCSYCLSYWAKGILYYTCGNCLCHTEFTRELNRNGFDALSISNYLISKGCPHGARHGKSEEQTLYHTAFNAWKRCRKRKDATGQNYTGILDIFWRIRSTVNHKKNTGWDEAKCEEMDKLAQEDHSYPLIRSEFLRYSSNWSTGPNKPMATRPDYRTAVAEKNYLYRKPEKYQKKTIPPPDQNRVRENNKFSDSYRSSSRQENWVEILDTFFKLVPDWLMGLERRLIESQVKATELRFDLIFLSLLQGFVCSRWNPL